MRLTLRTLLSWKDGMLPPEAARDLAGKVGASDAARRLVERIDEVAARPTLGASAPDATGFAASANTTAEYLDNALPADRLGEFERACFASDVQLAETAASHEILAAWSREPAAPLDAAARRRLLAAVRARATGASATDRSGIGDRGADAPRAAVTTVPPVPRRPARAPATAWLLVAAAVALLVVLVGVLGWSLARRGGHPGGGRDVAARPAEARAPDAAAAVNDEPAQGATAVDAPQPSAPAESAAPPDVAAPAAPAAEPAVAPSPAPPAVPADDGAGDVPAFAVDEPPHAAPAPAASTPPGRPVDPRVPQGDALAIAAPLASAPPAPAPSVTPPPPVGPPPAAAAQGAPVAVAGRDVLLHRPAGGAADAWLAGAEGTPLELPADLLAPPFGRPALVVDDTRITLEPGTRAVLGRDADGAPRLEVVFGAAFAAGGRRLGVTAGGLAGVIAAGLGAPVGVEVRITRPPGGPAESAERVARILPTAERLEWRPPAGVAGTAVAPGQTLVWRSGRPETALPEAVGSPPDWLAGRRGRDALDRWAAESLLRLPPGTRALPALRELAADRRSERRMAAAATLALVGEFDAVARLMCAADPGNLLPEQQWKKLDSAGVQQTLARGPKAAEALAAAFAAHAPPGAADTVVRFARGLGDEELAAGGDADLVTALESPHLVVRRYAIANLVEIVRPTAVERLKYRADRSGEGPRDGVAWWRARLEEGRIRRAP